MNKGKVMKKVFTSFALGSILLSGALSAEEVKSVPLNPDGFYLGVGGGVSFNVTVLSLGNYQDNTTSYSTGSLSDTDVGYIVYGGYQFNKIIAVEAAYTDYGSFSDTASKIFQPGVETFSSDPSTVSVYANAGYTFANGLRPFGQIGLG
jgi:opacity protein-like surface antigen